MGMVRLLFSYHGRVNRAQYWLGGLLVGVLYIFAWWLSLAPMMSGDIAAVGPSTLVSLILFLACAWSGLSLNVKRLHDRGRTGYLALLFLLPVFTMVVMLIGAATQNSGMLGSSMLLGLLNFIVSIFFFIDLGCLPSKAGPNRYGDSPSTGGASPPPVRPAKSGASAQSLDNALTAMERAIAARTASPAPSATPLARAPAPTQSASSAAPGAPKAFGRRAAH